MLVDVTFNPPQPHVGLVLTMIAGGRLIPERIKQGMYIASHWSIDQLGVPIRERWKETEYKELDYPEFGVCDYPDQVVSLYALGQRLEKLFVTFVKIEKVTQSARGGWRWHKWGPYIGNQNPQAEHIYDESEIDTVYTFHIYELKS